MSSIRMPSPTEKPTKAKPTAAASTAPSGTSGGATAPSAPGAVAARRLGRGLTSLLGTPVKVEVPQTAESTSHGVAAPNIEPKSTSTPPAPSAPTKPARAAIAKGDQPITAGLPAAKGSSAPIAAPTRTEEDLAAGAHIVMIAVNDIVPNRHQPRRNFDEAGLNELAASIRAAGVVQPVLVRKSGGAAGGRRDVSTDTLSAHQYELVAGERRLRASRIAGLKAVPAVVADLTEEQAAEWALIENVQRADLQPLEQAHAVKRLCEQFSLTHAQAGEKLGLDRSTITNLVRLTELEPEIQEHIEKQLLTAGHGKALLACPPGKQRVNLAKKCAADGWSVKRLAAAITLALSGKATGHGDAAQTSASRAKSALAAAGLLDLEKQLADHLGTKVQIKLKRGGKSGTVVVKFYDLDHFDGLMGKMGFVMR